MAEDKKISFPMLPAKHWWLLRKRFKQSIPGTVTDNYLSSVLGMEVKSARGNVLPYLESMGIIDEDGKTLDRAKRWRDDIEYPKVCEEILRDIYPSDLLDAFPGPEVERDAVNRWFSNYTGAGQKAVGRMIGTFIYLVKREPSAETESRPSDAVRKSVASRKRTPRKTKTETETQDNSTTVTPNPEPERRGPELNINLQIHISSDATPDQIDQMFRSMAKHIYNKE